MNSFKQGISSPPQKSVQFWVFQLNLRFCLKNSRRTDPHSRMSDMCKKTTLPTISITGHLYLVQAQEYPLQTHYTHYRPTIYGTDPLKFKPFTDPRYP